MSENLGPSLNNIDKTGGEPFARKDFDDIAKLFFKNTNIYLMFITSNSMYITSNSSLTKRVVRFSNLTNENFPNKKNYFSFSIDSFEEEHNKI